MSPVTSKQWILKEKPGDNIDLSKTFELKNVEINPAEGEMLVKVKYISNDPAQRTWMSKNIEPDRHYMKMVEVGDVMMAGAIGEVIDAGNSTDYKKGDMVFTYAGWAEYQAVKPSAVISKVNIDPTDYFAIGTTGLTAYFGLYEIGKPKETDKTIVVSGAAGSTGSVVIQIAKNVLGIKNVVGIAGSDEKCAEIKKLGCDVALNYKDADFDEKFEKATGEYIDIYWDNVGGHILDLAVNRMAKDGRIVACGAISGYNDMQGQAVSQASWNKIITMRVRVQGFVVMDFAKDYPKATKDLGTWVKAGKITPLKTVWETEFENVPEGMLKLIRGENTGKLVTKLV